MADEPIESLYARHGAMVLRRARALLRDEQAAWDALQEVFVRALKHQESFRKESSPTTWLYRITTNYCLNLLRDGARRGRRLRAYGSELETTTESPELRLALTELLGQVPDELCEIAIYHHLDRMSHEEIAGVMGVSRRTVGNRLREFQARAQALLDAPAAVVS